MGTRTRADRAAAAKSVRPKANASPVQWSSGMTNSVAAADPFVNKIHYTATASYSGTTETINTATATANTPTAGTITGGGPQTSTPLVLAVNITATPSGKYLANGTFDDTLIVTLSPVP